MAKDLFSQHAADYAKYRPNYPAGLFEHLASLVPLRGRAWDCATGNGQAAVGLAAHFEEVVATDASVQQLAQAAPHPRVSYRVALAENSGLESGSVDLVTVAQALHWFDLPQFYREARRVARGPGAMLAVWCYALAEIEHGVDAVVRRYYDEVVGEYWEPERRLVELGYQTIAWTFAAVPTPQFEMQVEWNLARLTCYLNTWSATQAAAHAMARNPLDAIAHDLARAWGDPGQPRRVRWPLFLRLAKLVEL